MRDSSIVFMRIAFWLPGAILAARTSINRLRPPSKAGKGNRPLEGVQQKSV
jgi:hypothetical protein